MHAAMTFNQVKIENHIDGFQEVENTPLHYNCFIFGKSRVILKLLFKHCDIQVTWLKDLNLTDHGYHLVSLNQLWVNVRLFQNLIVLLI